MKAKSLKDILNKIKSLLDYQERKTAVFLLFLLIVTAFLETIGIASIMPFLAVLSNPEVIQTNAILNSFYNLIGAPPINTFLVMLGIGALVVVIGANAISAYMTWLLSRFSHMRAHTISLRLLKIYLAQPYSFFTNRDSSDMAKNVLSEVSQVVKNVIVPGMQIIARILVCIFILALLIYIAPLLALSVMTILGLAYGIIYVALRKVIHTIGERRMTSTAERFKALAQIFAGIKDIIITGKEDAFVNKYCGPSIDTAESFAKYELISQIPRYIIESVTFSIIIFIIFYLISTEGSLEEAIPILGLYAFAGQRLMPALQNIFLNMSKLRFAQASLEHIIEEFSMQSSMRPTSQDFEANLPFNKSVYIKNVSFSYNETYILQNINLSVNKGDKIGFVGPTGAGKSTLLDIILGLRTPKNGQILVDDTPLTAQNTQTWQKKIGYVSQNIVLFNDTILNNIALGVPQDKIDIAAAEEAIKIAQLTQFIDQEAPNGYKTTIGENGVRLSGGQRQRLGIARALYNKPDILVLDEATSALDNITENKLMEAMENYNQNMTIISIAHRLTTLRNCNCIYYIDDGIIAASGTYEELIKTSEEFRALAQIG